MQDFNHQLWAAAIDAVAMDSKERIDDVAALDPNAFKALLGAHDPADSAKRTLLMIAYWEGRAVSASALIAWGSDIAQEDANGNSGYWYAKNYGAGARQFEIETRLSAGVVRLRMEQRLSERSLECEEVNQRPQTRHRPL